MTRVIAIRVDVDTSVGLKRGVPRLLDIFSQFGVRATFFIVMGPDTMGQHIKRFKHKNYFKRILHVNPITLIRSYGIAPFLYGTILPSPLIGSAHSDILKTVIAQGHDLGLHGYDHAWWADSYFDSMTDNDVLQEFERAYIAYYKGLNIKPSSFAAPNWRSDEKLFRVEDEYKLLYSSDLRGEYPFFPQRQGIIFKTLQIPVTLPCTHEYIQKGIPHTKVVDAIVARLTDQINVWTIHDWYEGLSQNQFVEQFIQQALRNRYTFQTLTDIAIRVLQQPERVPISNFGNHSLDGGIGDITYQIID